MYVFVRHGDARSFDSRAVLRLMHKLDGSFLLVEGVLMIISSDVAAIALKKLNDIK